MLNEFANQRRRSAEKRAFALEFHTWILESWSEIAYTMRYREFASPRRESEILLRRNAKGHSFPALSLPISRYPATPYRTARSPRISPSRECYTLLRDPTSEIRLSEKERERGRREGV